MISTSAEYRPTTYGYRVLRDSWRSDAVRSKDSRVGLIKDTFHVAISIESASQRWLASREPPLDLVFALVETVWIKTGHRDLDSLGYWSRKHCDFVGTDPELHRAYGYLMRRHSGVVQVEGAYRALESGAEMSHEGIRFCDSPSDLPAADETPADRDIPCNVVATPRLRDRKMVWLQVICSNYMMLGGSQIIQFTSRSELLAD